MEAPVSLRPTVYLVDSTIPPTLRPIKTAGQQQAVLSKLGRGTGTSKQKYDKLNLNNILNRVVFGTIRSIQELAIDTTAPASFVCFGTSNDTVSYNSLGLTLAESIVDASQNDRSCAIGIATLPIQAQDLLDQYILTKTLDWDDLLTAVPTAGPVRPLLDYARARKGAPTTIRILGLAVDETDMATVRQGGLQRLDPERRQRYVADPTGFIAGTSDPQFRLYTERVLLRDVDPDSTTGGDTVFAQRILAHEAAATVLARFAVENTPSVVICFAPVQDLRYMQGINGRLPRIYQALSNDPSAVPVTDNDVTTILLNPTQADSLSLTRRLRLEVGTGPDTIQYQMKLADYLWFSSSPPVYLLPRIMDV